MTGRFVRRSLQVAGLAAGILMFTGGMAQAAPEDDYSTADIDQGSMNVCGDNGFNSGVIFNATDCDAGNVAVATDDDDLADDYDYTSSDVDQGAGNICGDNAFNSGVIFNASACDDGNAAATDG